MLWIFDVESYSNFFSVIFKNPKTKEIRTFVLFGDRNDIDELHMFVNDTRKWLVGYNSFNFDNQILKYICRNHFELTMSSVDIATKNINDLVIRIIEDDVSDFKYRLPFQGLDLMKIGFYRKSLKLIGVGLKWPKLQELPYEPGALIEPDQVDTLLEYNLNDVLITEQLYFHLENNIKLRFNIAKRYGVNVYTESDSGIANRLLEKFHSEATGLHIKDFKWLRTARKYIPFNQVVFDEIHFHTNTFDKLLEEVKDFVYYQEQPFFSKSVMFDGIKYKMGVGGLHSVDKGAKFTETDDEYLIDADIGSFYPATLINNQLSPAHLGPKFLKNFITLRDDRIIAKKKKDMTPAEGLKIVLNSAIGKTLNKDHWLYDPIVNLRVTVNGQLYLLMLIERLALADLHTISANTDGITVIVPKTRLEEYNSICKNWENETRYELEYTYYTLYARRDVNNYIAIKPNGSVKTKGIFTKDAPTKFSNGTDPLTKGFDKPIVSIAIYEYLVNDIPIEETIRNHTDIYDFCISKKIDNKFTNEFHYIKDGKHITETLQKSVRYYVSKAGGTLLKVDKEIGKVFNYESGKTVTMFNDYFEREMPQYDLDYAYYIHHVQKVLDEIINPQLSLWDNN